MSETELREQLDQQSVRALQLEGELKCLRARSVSESELRELLDRQTLRTLGLEDELKCLRARFGIVEPHPLVIAEGESAVPDIPNLISPLSPADAAEDAPELLEGAVAKAQTAWRKAVEHIKSAIRNDEFRLYCREIKDLTADVPPFYGILVRQAEEEQNRMPPGAFFALAEEYGLMSELDRWVVCGVLGWASAHKQGRASLPSTMYCIDLSRDTIGDPHFPEFVQAQLKQSGVPVETLCFKVQVLDVIALRVDSAELIRNLRSLGCRTMLGGFGGDRVSLEILKEMRFDFLLIDGSLVYNILRSEASLTKMRGIARLAHAVGIKTVAELVESTATVVKLRELHIDYAQGEAIAAALPLHDLH